MTDVRRSMLQRKDRGELTQIAAALGAKPPNKARKNEIIKLILDLASQGSDEASGTRKTNKTSRSKAKDNKTSASASSSKAAASSAKSSTTQATPSKNESTDPTDETNAETTESETNAGNRRRRRRTRARDNDPDEGWTGGTIKVEGCLDLRDEGYGFLRVDEYLPSRKDAYVPIKTIRQYGLRRGDYLIGESRPANRSEKNPALLTLESINGVGAELTDRPFFEDLTPVHATQHLTLEQTFERPTGPKAKTTARLLDLITPLGFGQRVLVWISRRSDVSSFFSSIIPQIQEVQHNHSNRDVHLMGLFIDQLPEDITEKHRWINDGGNSETAATSFDQPAEEHILTTEMVVERAKRLAEKGKDVVLLFDGITALARAYNTALSNAGKAYSNKVENGAVHMPKKLFGAGRNLEEAGSITMIATIANSLHQMKTLDRIVCEEFTDTANTDIYLDRWAGECDLFPPIDIIASRSHNEHHFVDSTLLQHLQKIRRSFINSKPTDSISVLKTALDSLEKTSDNNELLQRLLSQSHTQTVT